MRARSFCFLESDQKTYRDFLAYYSILENNQKTFDVDMLIQKRALESHLKNQSLSNHNQDAICNWINTNSSALRSYINSLKMVSMFQYYHLRSLKQNTTPDFESFCSAVEFWNREKSTTVDSIFI